MRAKAINNVNNTNKHVPHFNNSNLGNVNSSHCYLYNCSK